MNLPLNSLPIEARSKFESQISDLITFECGILVLAFAAPSVGKVRSQRMRARDLKVCEALREEASNNSELQHPRATIF